MDDRETLSNLKFICKIGKGEKINISMMCVQPNSIFTTISRTILHQDNRKNTLLFTTQTINKAFVILKTLKTSSNVYSNAMADNITKDLIDSKSGLENLKYTYSNDVKFCCDIDTLLQIINARLGDYGIEQDEPHEYIDLLNLSSIAKEIV
jgi:hypothetical protein